MKLNIIVPTYNEEEVIEQTLQNLVSQLTVDYKLIIVDDCSVDSTPAIISRVASVTPRATAIFNSKHQGYVEVIKQGVNNVSQEDALLVLMADGCDDASLIETMYKETSKGVDVVCGSRYVKGGERIGGPWSKALGSWLINQVLFYTKKIPCHDTTNSFKIFRRNVFEAGTIESLGFEIFMEVTLKAYLKGFKITEIPTRWIARKAGKSKFRLFSHGLRYLKWFVYALRHVH